MRTSTSLSIAHRACAAATASLLAFATVSAFATPAHADEVNGNGKGIAGGALLGIEAVTIPMGIANVHSSVAYLVGGGLGAVAGGVGGYFVEQNSSDGRAPAYMLVGGLGLIIPALVLSLNATRYVPSENTLEDHAPTNAPAANPGSPGGSAVVPAAGGAAYTAPTMAAPTGPGGGATAPAAGVSGGFGVSGGASTTPAAGAAPTPAPATTPPAGAAPATTSPATAPATTPPATTTPAPAPSGGGKTPPLSLVDVNDGSMRLGLPVPEVRPMFSMTELRQYGMAQQTEVRMPIVKVTF